MPKLTTSIEQPVLGTATLRCQATDDFNQVLASDSMDFTGDTSAEEIQALKDSVALRAATQLANKAATELRASAINANAALLSLANPLEEVVDFVEAAPEIQARVDAKKALEEEAGGSEEVPSEEPAPTAEIPATPDPEAPVEETKPEAPVEAPAEEVASAEAQTAEISK